MIRLLSIAAALALWACATPTPPEPASRQTENSRALDQSVAAWRESRAAADAVRTNPALTLDTKAAALENISQKARPARDDALARLKAVLATSGWPDAERFGAGTESNAWFVLERSGDDEVRATGVTALAPRMVAGLVDRGRFALLRDQNTPLLPGESSERPVMVAAHLADITAIRAYQAGLAPPATAGEELERMVALDQFWRLDMLRLQKLSASPPRESFLQAVKDSGEAIDRAHVERLKQMLDGRGWFDNRIDGPRASYDAWLLVQHSPEVAFQREILERLAPLLSGGQMRKEDYALLYDRVALRDGRPQRYGSQMQCDHGEFVAAAPLEDPATLDARRATMDLMPWADYRDYMVGNGMGVCKAR